MATKKKKTTKKKKAVQAVGKIWISRQYGKDPEQRTEQHLEVSMFPEGVEPAYIKVGYGMTVNLGNYESARCDVGVTLPCTVEEIPDAFKEAWKIAKKEIKAQTKGIKSND